MVTFRPFNFSRAPSLDCYAALSCWFFFSFFLHRELHSLIKSCNCVKGPSHNHLEGGISFGIGAFNLVRPKSLFRHHHMILWWFWFHMVHEVVFVHRRSLSSLRGSWNFWSLRASPGTRCDPCDFSVALYPMQSWVVPWRVRFCLRKLACLCCVTVPPGWTCAPCCALCCYCATTHSSRLY